MLRVDPESPAGREILAFEADRQAVLIAGDRPGLERILHPELVHIHSSGLVHGKAAFIDHVGRMGGFVSITRGDLALHATADGVLITGETVNRVRRLETGETVDLRGFGTVFALRGQAGWQVLLSQITPFKTA